MKKKIKTTAILGLGLLSVAMLAGCETKSESARKSDSENIAKGVETGKKYDLVFDDNQVRITKLDSRSEEVVQYLNNKKVETVFIPLDTDGTIKSGSLTYQTTVLRDQNVEPYVVFEKSDDKTNVHVYRQPYVAYNQQPTSGTVVDKEGK